MSFADRRYSRHDGRSSSGGWDAGEWTAVVTIVLLNVGVWVANLVVATQMDLPPNAGPVLRLLTLHGDLPRHLLNAWELVTYGFAHDGASLWHLGLNMLTLWFLGPVVEDQLGKWEFLRFWVAAIIVAGVAWVASVQLGQPEWASRAGLVGASGAVMAMLAVFVWNNPRQELLLWGLLPVPAWALGLLYFFSDVNGAYHGSDNVAHVAHIGGALFGAAYAWRGWNIGECLEAPGLFLKSRRKFNIVRPDGPVRSRSSGKTSRLEIDADPHNDAALQEAVDRILEKISRSGESALTPEERDTLTRASRRLKERLR